LKMNLGDGEPPEPAGAETNPKPDGDEF